MKLAVINIAFSPASQFARGLIEYRKNRGIIPDRHIVVLGYYPINTDKNNRDIRMLCDSFGDLEVWDPGHDLGSAQSQTWALNQLKTDYWINQDSDSNCRTMWDINALTVLQNDPDCVVISCKSPLINRFIEERKYKPTVKEVKGVEYEVFTEPVPFNLSMWCTSFIKSIGGVPQLGERWGETEGPIHYYATKQGKYHAYLVSHMEDESGKLMQDKQLLEYKDAHMRTVPRFHGVFIEYLRKNYKYLTQMDTLIPSDTVFQ